VNQPDNKNKATFDYYEANAASYARQTQTADLGELYAKFLPSLGQGARILDVGCGAGRDLKAFREQGFQALGIDPSPTLAKIAREHSGCDVLVERVEEMRFMREFDGAWACASLLHLPRSVLPLALRRIHEALRPNGVFLLSMQLGLGEMRMADGRFYTRYQPADLRRDVEAAGFDIVDAWQSSDSLDERRSIRWINIIGRAGGDH
jgi:SAM-dependent methyltransferase